MAEFSPEHFVERFNKTAGHGRTVKDTGRMLEGRYILSYGWDGLDESAKGTHFFLVCSPDDDRQVKMIQCDSFEELEQKIKDNS